MKLTLDGIGSYDLEDILSHATLNDLFYLKVKTKSADFPTGVSMKSLGTSLQKFEEYEDASDVLDDVDGLMALRALVWLCRRSEAPQITLDEANDFDLEKLGFDLEEGDTEDPPQAPQDSDPDDEHPAAAPKASTTSKRRSAPGSRSSRTSGRA